MFCGRGFSLCSTCQDPLASAGGGWSLFLLGGAGSLLLRRRARRVSGIFFVFYLILGFVVGLGFKEWREIHLVVLHVKKRPVRGRPKVERDRGCSHLKVGTNHYCQTGAFGV
jgi:hypothetical protein